MFKVNDTIIYGSEGVCQIVAIEENDFVGVKKTYYVIKPLGKDSSTTYVPIDSEILVVRMRKLLTKKEINELIDALPNEPIKWLSSERDRKEAYKNIIESGNRIELMKMIRAVYLEKQQRESMHKRLHIIDERFMKDAEQCLYSEFQHVLNIRQEEIIPYIVARIEKKKKT